MAARGGATFDPPSYPHLLVAYIQTQFLYFWQISPTAAVPTGNDVMALGQLMTYRYLGWHQPGLKFPPKLRGWPEKSAGGKSAPTTLAR